MKYYFKDSGKEVVILEVFSDDGGEAIIYRISGQSDYLAKIYRTPDLSLKKEKKVSIMVKYFNENVGKIKNLFERIAFPEAEIVDEDGRFSGYLMKCHKGEHFAEIYSYPGSTYTIRDRVSILIDLCDLLERIHNMDINAVLADFNPLNVLVDSNQSVFLVDLDSIYFKYGTEEFPCVGCYSGYIPPEIIKGCRQDSYEEAFLQGSISFRKSFDYFNLAIHIFCCLMNGIHPFQDTPVGDAVCEEENKRILSGESIFFNNTQGKMIPVYSPDYVSFPRELRNMFHRAFVEGYSDPSARPTEGEWKRCLIQYRDSLVDCSKNLMHAYNPKSTNHHCPYCEANRAFELRYAAHGQQIQVPVLSKKKQSMIF